MRTALSFLMIPLALGLGGCAKDEAPTAMAAVEQLGAALRTGDRARCRELITRESAQALPELPWDELSRQEPLAVLRARPRHLGYFVEVRNPNEDGALGEFVVVPERGRYVVDLIATAGLTAREVVGGGAEDTMAPRALTPADHDRIRQIELASPR